MPRSSIGNDVSDRASNAATLITVASAGYLVFAPNHRDAICNGGSARWIDRPEQNFGKPETWDETSFRDRADDIVYLVAALNAMLEWRNRIDWQRFGLVGHSLGCYTVLGLSARGPVGSSTGSKPCRRSHLMSSPS
jgi:predicted dienelactone hydrolase